MATPSPAPSEPPKPPGKLQKDLTTLGGSVLGGVMRGVLSGAWQFGRVGFAIGALAGTVSFLIGASFLTPLIGWTVAGVIFGGGGMAVLNVARGLFDGLGENFHRNRTERKIAKSQEQAQSPSPQQNQTVTLKPNATTLSHEVGTNGNAVTAVSSPAPGSVQSYRVSGDSTSVAVSDAGDNKITRDTVHLSAIAHTASMGQGPSGGGSWEELVRKNSSAHLPSR